MPLTYREARFLDRYRQLPPDAQAAVQVLIENLAGRRAEAAKTPDLTASPLQGFSEQPETLNKQA